MMSTRYAVKKFSNFNKISFSTLKYIPHAFGIEQAMQKFSKADAKRIFAPISRIDTTIVQSADNPLKKAYIPMFGIDAEIKHTTYTGEYGIHQTYYNAATKTVQTITHWYPVSGRLQACSYTQENSDIASIYAGSSYCATPIEAALRCHNFQDKLITFNSEHIPLDIFIDPFDKKSAYAYEQMNSRIHNAEVKRAQNDIWLRHKFINDVRIDSIRIDSTITIKQNMLPAYILQYPHTPIRVISAISTQDNEIYGAVPISATKVMGATFSTTTLLSLFIPTVDLPIKLGLIFASTLISGLISRNKLAVQDIFQESNRIIDIETNESINATFADIDRLNSTSRDVQENAVMIYEVELIHYKVLSLNPDADISEDEVNKAFNEKMKLAHPDKGGSPEESIKLIEARNAFKKAFKSICKNHDTSKRFFSTSRPKTLIRRPALTHEQKAAKIALAEPLRSIYYPNTAVLIKTVLEEKNYSKALQLVRDEVVHPDGHDNNENTLLTEAVKRNDVKAVLFALKNLGCSVDVSCDCPMHNTALHYAAESHQKGDDKKDNVQIMEILLNAGARVNLLNSCGKTALDMAHDDKIKQLLIAHGGITNHQGLFTKIKGFFGRFENERTLLIKQEQVKKIEQQNAKQHLEEHHKTQKFS